ncbi:hypothetical protein VOLCADRAFT_105100 [Volvox carteri f. nagariensis]|uniref:Uncharacterized protein n=1 Tax=Volvox carteri f. nagariensis TaxID=3068 RepID=D8TYF9_VOLCA|nr:uncharacterized protein VOLCADRAFT_105100 [Volvox carteri f. nagariensis]EFJ47632.1 hypothetical protein VOLCADRAFT_105100 [Volvox carteri f. nagariensis]|eukprot:XP_002951456.1 hypothetical protein VOLCADRAFT_105100 [Volvox carteri f. nagariensis]
MEALHTSGEPTLHTTYGDIAAPPTATTNQQWQRRFLFANALPGTSGQLPSPPPQQRQQKQRQQRQQMIHSSCGGLSWDRSHRLQPPCLTSESLWQHRHHPHVPRTHAEPPPCRGECDGGECDGGRCKEGGSTQDVEVPFLEVSWLGNWEPPPHGMPQWRCASGDAGRSGGGGGAVAPQRSLKLYALPTALARPSPAAARAPPPPFKDDDDNHAISANTTSVTTNHRRIPAPKQCGPQCIESSRYCTHTPPIHAILGAAAFRTSQRGDCDPWVTAACGSDPWVETRAGDTWGTAASANAAAYPAAGQDDASQGFSVPYLHERQRQSKRPRRQLQDRLQLQSPSPSPSPSLRSRVPGTSSRAAGWSRPGGPACGPTRRWRNKAFTQDVTELSAVALAGFRAATAAAEAAEAAVASVLAPLASESCELAAVEALMDMAAGSRVAPRCAGAVRPPDVEDCIVSPQRPCRLVDQTYQDFEPVDDGETGASPPARFGGKRTRGSAVAVSAAAAAAAYSGGDDGDRRDAAYGITAAATAAAACGGVHVDAAAAPPPSSTSTLPTPPRGPDGPQLLRGAGPPHRLSGRDSLDGGGGGGNRMTWHLKLYPMASTWAAAAAAVDFPNPGDNGLTGGGAAIAVTSNINNKNKDNDELCTLDNSGALVPYGVTAPRSLLVQDERREPPKEPHGSFPDDAVMRAAAWKYDSHDRALPVVTVWLPEAAVSLYDGDGGGHGGHGAQRVLGMPSPEVDENNNSNNNDDGMATAPAAATALDPSPPWRRIPDETPLSNRGLSGPPPHVGCGPVGRWRPSSLANTASGGYPRLGRLAPCSGAHEPPGEGEGEGRGAGRGGSAKAEPVTTMATW